MIDILLTILTVIGLLIAIAVGLLLLTVVIVASVKAFKKQEPTGSTSSPVIYRSEEL